MAHDLTHTDDMNETQQQTDTSTADAHAYRCEMCNKPAEVLAATEQDGGMSYEAWPLCIEHHIASLPTTFSNADDMGAPIQVMVVARVANVNDAESVERQMKRLGKTAIEEDRKIQAERLYDELQEVINGGNKAARAGHNVWDTVGYNLDINKIHLVMKALAML